ncbi:mitochondrial fission ELM1 family protein [Asticcacaulis sp. EMRT-3]|uniref:mitochondrial fission ELM1 family protein n=1 Tax=Asticcacaulis sp. EMRT-3 TaxID=3040349 RepID=UPI0024AECCA7|nr:mitochondrial fission ELM1 family protein [Asticcacaulis sp. EMRT-3]MDI7776247.1 mitochondrial fission ELM1 family protein [Asticcacaulis sp. EMRT-3]
MATPLTIWVVSDGRAGIENQALGLAEAVTHLTPAAITVKRLRYQPLFDRWPTALKLWPDAMLARDSDRIDPPYPDIWIGCGRASLPHALRMRQRSGGRSFVVQLQNPRHDPRAFDLVIAPEHDHVRGGHVLSLIGSTNRVTPERLTEAYADWRERIEALPHPRVAVLIGGRSKAYDLDADHAAIIAGEIHSAVKQSGGSLLLTVSRRTPSEASAILMARLGDLPGILHDGSKSDPSGNPYFAFLHAADHFLITEDSVNMATEAAATGKPIQIISLVRRSLASGEKFEDFHETLRAHGAAHPFNGRLAGAPYAPLAETQRAAQVLLETYRQKAGELSTG